MILILSNIIKLKPQIQTHNYKQKFSFLIELLKLMSP